ncbi:D-glycero-beta-D-manno-heptose 1,7-bisphosphate 7-phosphatase [Mucilaginibacter glaciei]|uniref:D,D-heptose 1,7-bisphosphate phosphatase n=1 Tax=Mucilaginibacter glaciei TaxID=2772109 RepID=A0A926NSQ9_9SPHI|nr:D-glycero-beta-D-manno-heptose 1,7-bisphosphate 7-phosphatase [Mucilaginibacter glaciei]MBD1394638.1 D-glycero-beta-D-manno-heptose 1,7-bisphosphate 7-phosphatase [Mucilaginibacter glaciei]
MKKALFLDRDGVINIDKNYVYKISDFEFVDGIFDLCRKFQNDGYLIIVITNQAGIARGYYTTNDFKKLTAWMTEQFKVEGVMIDNVYFCPHHPDFNIGCDCRKPNPGMILDAVRDFDIDLSLSLLIGDKQSDLDAGSNAGIKKLILTKKDQSLRTLEYNGVKLL